MRCCQKYFKINSCQQNVTAYLIFAFSPKLEPSRALIWAEKSAKTLISYLEVFFL